MPDALSDYDVIIGPVANDTIFNTMGIMTSGFLSDEEAIEEGKRQFAINEERYMTEFARVMEELEAQ